MVWGTSPVWQGDRQEEIRGSSGIRGFNPTRIGLHLQEFTLEVHERDYSIEQFHEEMIRVLYYHDFLLSGDMQRASRAYDELDSEWSEGCFTPIRMAWDLGRIGQR